MQILIPVVLSGGSGTRFGRFRARNIQSSYCRSSGRIPYCRLRSSHGRAGRRAAGAPLMVCNEEYRFVIAEQLRLMETKGTIVLEPVGRNTAPALTLAAWRAIGSESDPILLVMPADHVILIYKFSEWWCVKGMTLAYEGAMVTFGITPGFARDGLRLYSIG